MPFTAPLALQVHATDARRRWFKVLKADANADPKGTKTNEFSIRTCVRTDHNGTVGTNARVEESITTHAMDQKMRVSRRSQVANSSFEFQQ